MFLSRAFGVATLSLLALRVGGTNTPPSTIATTTEGAHVSQSSSVTTEGFILVNDFLSFGYNSIPAAASIITATTSKYATSYEVPWITYTIGCVTPTPTQASDLCSSASLYTFTEEYGGAIFKYHIPIPWYANPADRNDPHASASLTAVWTERCTYGPGLISRKCYGSWTSFTFPAPTDASREVKTTGSFITPAEFAVTAGWENMDILGSFVTQKATQRRFSRSIRFSCYL